METMECNTWNVSGNNVMIIDITEYCRNNDVSGNDAKLLSGNNAMIMDTTEYLSK